MTVRGIRGATTVVQDDGDAVLVATDALVREMSERNRLVPEAIIAVLLSTPRFI